MRPRPATRTFLLALTISAAAGFLFFQIYQKTHAPARIAGALPDTVYVWQYQWTPAVADAVRTAAADSSITQLQIVAAEIMPGGEKPAVRRIAPDYALLARTGKPVALVFRIGTDNGKFSPEAPMSLAIADAIKTALADARAAGLTPAEIQIDFDCPTRRLADYAERLEQIKQISPATPLTFTALPAWLAAGDLKKLVAAADGFTLQVHSVEKPAGKNQTPAPLCDTAKTRRWVEQAARIAAENRKKFLVALPTYTYRIAYDSAGRYTGVAAESPSNIAPRAAAWKLIPADAPALAALVNDWKAAHPANLAGIAWYRLPVAGDQYNWTLAAWNKVRRGEPPTAELTPEFRETAPELRDIFLKNTGDLAVELPEKFSLTWAGAAPVMLDALGGYRISAQTPTSAVFEKIAPAPLLLQPDTTRSLGWIRFDKPPEKLSPDRFEK